MSEALSSIADVFARSPQALSLADARSPDHPLLLVNDRFCAMTGYERDYVIGQNCRFLQREGYNVAARSAIRASIENGRDIQIELQNYRANGEAFVNFLIMYAIRDRKGVRYFMGSQFEVGRATRVMFERHTAALDDSVGEVLSTSADLVVSTRKLMAESTVAMLRMKLSIGSS